MAAPRSPPTHVVPALVRHTHSIRQCGVRVHRGSLGQAHHRSKRGCGGRDRRATGALDCKHEGGRRSSSKFLKFDATHPSAKAVIGGYAPAKLLAAGYPNLLTADIDPCRGDAAGHLRLSAKDTADSLGPVFSPLVMPELCDLAIQRAIRSGKRRIWRCRNYPRAGAISAKRPTKSRPALRGRGNPPRAPKKACGAEERALGLCK